jgi:ATP-dependent DNA helicase RecQ
MAANMDCVFSKCEQKFNIEKFKSFQLDCLCNLLDGKDVFVSCKTGSGKSICFEAYATAIDMFPRIGLNCITIIVEPLVSIMKEGVNRLSNIGIRAVCLNDDNIGDNENDIILAKYDFIYTSAEKLLGEDKWRNMLTSSAYHDHCLLIAIDEAHTIINW